MQPKLFTRIGYRCQRLILLAAVFACALALPTSAGADTASGNPELGPTLGDGYVYWTTATRERGDGKGKGPIKTRTIHQRRLSDGRERIIFRAHRSTMSGLYAHGDKVAFSITRFGKFGKERPSLAWSDLVYAMSAEDAFPTKILDSPMRFDGKSGFCGKGNDLHDISTNGQVLAGEWEMPCSRGGFTSTAALYPLAGGTPVSVPEMIDAEWAVLQYGRLAITTKRKVTVRDLASGQVARFPQKLAPYWVMLSPAGDLATATELDYSWRRGKAHTQLKIYPAGSTTPSAKINEWVDGTPVMVFCSSGLAELSIPGSGPMRIRLRALDGTVIKSLNGPTPRRPQYAFDSTCVGNHLTIASSRNHESPTINAYDL